VAQEVPLIVVNDKHGGNTRQQKEQKDTLAFGEELISA
jgi:hypothetical protein